MTEAVEIVNLFVGPGEEVVKTLGKVDKFDATYRTKNQAVDEDIPLVVMINRNTASAAEIVAGAVQDLDRGVVIGQRSYGKGLVQVSRPLSYNAILKVTTAKYYIPSGRCVQALDFTHRNEDGSVGHIPDSLISEFKTRNGRTVRDGGGIRPDYNIETPRLSQVATELYLRSFIFDYATSFYWNNKEILSPGEFKLSDADYNKFRDFLKEKEFSYETATEDALQRLLNTSREEKYYEVNKELFEDLKFKLEHNLDNDLSVFKDEIVKLIEDEIILRYFYEEGMIEHTIKDDPYIKKSVEVLTDSELYSSILKGDAGLLSDEPLLSRNNAISEKDEQDISC
jgi:carboxyl-terminal processing protease